MTVDAGPRHRRRLGRDDWVAEATEVLASHGLSAVAVEPLAERLGVTKGSFYAHFANRDELVAAVMARWKVVDTDEVIASLEGVTDARERLTRFLEFGFERHDWGRVFAALCARAADPAVGPVMNQARAARVGHLEKALRELGLTRAQAHDRANLIYATYVGFWRLVAADPSWEYNQPAPLRRMAAHIRTALIPESNRSVHE
jgi:AcrR family transcriptional regulator